MKHDQTMKKCRIALCRHEIPGSDPHLDLFVGPVEPRDDDELVARSWRLTRDPRELQPTESLQVTPLPLHRAKYLRLEGPVRPRSQAGQVIPLWRAQCSVEEPDADRLRITIRWQDGLSGRFDLGLQRIQRLPSTETET
ncbi:MAG: hypothetical protein CBC35_07735 [Planctomycetes bacterium TMED75]|nr:hypothetical protein [Planctomycetaceae bacterium]OUU92246.1 MAG: hypothetical protein CBC35_07735 [Planctomycetes bacterium TMED75]